MTVKDPRPGLDRLGVKWEQVVDPTDGYDGTFTPECVYAHWTASAAGSDVSAHVVAINDYHACVARNGVVALGGWQVKQAHGGSGRQAPINQARHGGMTIDEITGWQLDGRGDDTDTMPNQFGLSVAIDNNGIGEGVPAAQWHAFTATAAVLLDCINRPGPGWLIDHAASTNRKIDLATSPALLPARWYPDIATQLALLRGDPTVAEQIACAAIHPAGNGAAHVRRSDGAVFVTGRNAMYFGGLNHNPTTDKPYTQSPCHTITWSKSGNGYVMFTEDGGAFTFGDATFPGSAVDLIQ